jgi:hypothetical protein
MGVAADLIRGLLAAVAAGVLPGYFWAAVLRPASGLAERLAYSAALSMAGVPLVAILLARATGGGLTLWIALLAVAIVLGTGLLAYRIRGGAPGPATPALPSPAVTADPRVLTLVAGTFVLVLASMLRTHPPAWLVALITVLVLLAGVLIAGPALAPGNGSPAGRPPGGAAGGGPGNGPDGGPAAGGGPGPGAGAGAGPGPGGPGGASGLAAAGTLVAAAGSAAPAEPAGLARPASPGGPPIRGLRAGALLLILGLTAYRAYSGVISHDWPYLRGGDQFSHAVMAQQMLTHGSYGTYLIYPPGFPALTAVICRFSGLAPLHLFPVLAPAFLALCALAGYALATGLWGWPYGLAAAALNGLVLDGAYDGFAEGRYPDLVAGYFLIVMVVAALVTLYHSASVRSAALLAVTAASVVLYHSVVTLYVLVLLALAAVTGLPYLLYRRERQAARMLALALAGAAVLAVCFAALTYNLGGLITGRSSTSTAVSIALGSQPVPAAGHLLTALGPAIVWLGLFGAGAAAAGIRRLAQPGQVLATVTVLLWAAVMYLGSRTALDGFPQRFERDLGAPLSVLAALGVVLVVRAVLAHWQGSRTGLTLAAAAAAAVIAVVVIVQTARSLQTGARPGGEVLTHRVAAAGRWLGQHNTGGNVISTPYLNPGIGNRAVLAMGGYTGLQAYGAYRIAHPRSLPPAGRQPLLDSNEVLLHPASCQAGAILARDDVRYVLLYRFGNGADLPAFAADPARYHLAFANPSVLIYATTRGPSGGAACAP